MSKVVIQNNIHAEENKVQCCTCYVQQYQSGVNIWFKKDKINEICLWITDP